MQLISRSLTCKPDKVSRRGAATAALLAGALVCGIASAGCDTAGVTSGGCGFGEFQIEGECRVVGEIAINSVGFLPDSTKRASAPSGASFAIFNEDGDEVFSGDTTTAEAPDTEDSVRVADFSALTDPGRYTIEFEGLEGSEEIWISERVYDEALESMVLGLYGQRCGTSVEFEWHDIRFSHGTCHTEDGLLTYAEQEDTGEKDGTGGWHDAGDYGKYTVNGAFAAAILLKAYEHFEPLLAERAFPIPEQGGDLPDVLDEVRVQLEWLLKMQFEDGQAAHKLTTVNFVGDVMPEGAGGQRYFTAPGTAATADLAAVMAQAARIYRPFDGDFADECLAAAQRGIEYLLENPENFRSPTPQDPSCPSDATVCFMTGGYGDGQMDDERAWALAEYWETTGDADVLAELESRLAGLEARHLWDWPDVGNLALYTYALSERADRAADLVAQVQESIVLQGDQLAEAADDHGYGRSHEAYYWGVNGVVARTTMNLVVADRLAPDPKYHDAVVRQVDHLLGRNYFKRSFVTGVGKIPPQRPHHRPSTSDGIPEPWPGHLIGGPNPNPTEWRDASSDYRTNEVAINWTTTMIYAVLATLPN